MEKSNKPLTMTGLSIQDIYTQEVILFEMGLRESDLDTALILFAMSMEATEEQMSLIMSYIGGYAIDPQKWSIK